LLVISVLKWEQREKRCWMTKRQARRSLDVLARAAPGGGSEGGAEGGREGGREGGAVRRKKQAESNCSSLLLATMLKMVCKGANELLTNAV
jgi:hypothetical protein